VVVVGHDDVLGTPVDALDMCPEGRDKCPGVVDMDPALPIRFAGFVGCTPADSFVGFAIVRVFAALTATALVLVPGLARADGLSEGETARLLRGEAVSRTQQLDLGRRHYVGGVTYEIVDAAPEQLAPLLDEVSSWRRFLPKARDSAHVGDKGGDALVAITHGSSLLQVAYTLQVHRDADGIRFWLDRDRPHDIDDAWGYMRATPMPHGRTLLTWGILVDMGPGLLRDLFEDKVQAQALLVPDRVRDVVYERAARGQRAAR
jgi:hypothetical protein